MKKSTDETRVGISGWRFPPWRKVFYPPGLAQRKELEYASRQLNSIELNGSFYALQSPESYQRWFHETPDDFQFSIKATQYVTHIRRLKDCEIPLANFFGSGLLHLEHKLGPVLWQLPPSFLFYQERFEEFLPLLPRTFAEAAKLSLKADRVEPSFSKSAKSSQRKIRHAIEVRHHSFENPDFVKLLRKHDIALVFADTSGKWPYLEDLTSDFVYLRLHGEKEIYKSGYDDKALLFWKERIAYWKRGEQVSDALTLIDGKPTKLRRSVYAYFDNDQKIQAPFDAMRLQKMLQKN